MDTSNAKLSCILNENFFLYFITSKTGEVLAQEEIKVKSLREDELLEELNQICQNPLLNKVYQSVLINIDREKAPFFLIPDVLFEPAEKENYFVQKIPENAKVLVESIPGMDATLLFCLNKKLFEYFSKKFPSATIASELYYVLINLRARIPYKQALILLKKEAHFYLFLYSDQKLEFINQFNYSSASDIAYYILLTYNQFNLSQTDVPLIIMIEELKEEQEILKHYISKIEILKGKSSLNHSYAYPSILLT